MYFARKARRRPKPVEIRTEVETRVSSDGSEPRVGSRKMNDDDKREIRRETEKKRLIFVKFYIFGYSRYSRDNWDFQVEEEDCESTGINTYLTKLINRQGNWIEIYCESFHELAPVASGAEGEDTGDPCLRSRSCIYTGSSTVSTVPLLRYEA